MFETTKAATTSASEAVEVLNIVVSSDDPTVVASTAGEKGIFGRMDGGNTVRQIPVAVLRENLQRTIDGLQEVLGEIRVPDDGMSLQQAQVTFEVTASGGINLIGTSAQVGTKGAITLTFGVR
ncbi:Pepco domain-containing protein [Streptomyces sp. NPDC001222]|uniref:Pepco domain-containing protein n=1 Tax=Streptomyces sp. NPDC001222 TaxID=3364548 RepID=UPI003691533A